MYWLALRNRVPSLLMNLLLVDDHALFREGLRTLLLKISPGRHHFRSRIAWKARSTSASSTQFRMVLLDLGLANSDGLDTLDAFRSSVPNVPVIVLSGDQEPQHIRAAIDRGAVGYVPKSHTADLMIAALRFVLVGRHLSAAERARRRSRARAAGARSWRSCFLAPLAAAAAGLATAVARAIRTKPSPGSWACRKARSRRTSRRSFRSRREKSRRGRHARGEERHQGDVVNAAGVLDSIARASRSRPHDHAAMLRVDAVSQWH